MNKGVSPYAFGVNISNSWYDLGTVSSSGAWHLIPNGGISSSTTFPLSITFTGSGTAANAWLNQSGVASSATLPEIGGQFTMTSNVGNANKSSAYKIALTTSVVGGANSADIYALNTIASGYNTQLITGIESDINVNGGAPGGLGASNAAYGFVSTTGGLSPITAGYWAVAYNTASMVDAFASSGNVTQSDFHATSTAPYGLLLSGNNTGLQILGPGFNVTPSGAVNTSSANVTTAANGYYLNNKHTLYDDGSYVVLTNHNAAVPAIALANLYSYYNADNQFFRNTATSQNYLTLSPTAAALTLKTSVATSGPAWGSFTTNWDQLSSNVNSFPSSSTFGAGTVSIASAVTGLMNVPSTDTAGNANFAVAGYGMTASTSKGAVGLFGLGTVNADGLLSAGISAWGGNTVTTNGGATNPPANTGHTNAVLYGWEYDFNISALSGGAAPNVALRGLYFIGASQIQTTSIATTIDIDGLNYTGSKIPWKIGLNTNDGAVTNAINIGANAVNTGSTSAGSQPITFNGYQAGVAKAASIYSDPFGNLILNPQSGTAVVSNGIVYPGTDNSYSLGLSSNRWLNVYSLGLSLGNTSNSNITKLQAGVATAAVTYTLPTSAPGGSNYALVANSGGVMSWVNPTTFPSGTLTVGTTPTSGGATGQLMYDSGSVLQESANLVFASNTLTVGKATSTTGALALGGATSGTATITAQATAGTPTLTLPNTSGTLVSTASAPLSISSTTGAISITGAAGQILAGSTPAFTATPTLGVNATTTGTLGFANGGTTGATVTVQNNGATTAYNFNLPTSAGTSGQPLLSGGGGSSAMTFGTLGVGAGGTGLTIGTSGGIPYFNATNTMASSALLAQYQLVVGGGAGAAPATLGATGSAGQHLQSGGAAANPSWTTATFPATTTAGTILASGSANAVTATATPTLGVQGTTQGTLTFANTNVGAFPTTIQSSNSATAAATYTLPTATPGTNGYVLTATTAGVMSWTAPSALAAVLTVGTTATSGGAAGQLMYDSGSVLQESANLLFSSNTLTVGKASTATGGVALANTGSAFTTTIQAGVNTPASWTLTLPVAVPAANGAVLTSTTAGASSWVSVLPVANGGTNCSAASITCFNNITGFTASGTTGTTSTNLVFSTSPTLVTPVLGVATGTSLALNGATIGTNALAVTGTTALSSTLTSAAHTITATSANALTVGQTGLTNPAFNVSSSAVGTGINVTAAAAGSGVAVATTSSGTNENLTIDAKGTGNIYLSSVSTGSVGIGNSNPFYKLDVTGAARAYGITSTALSTPGTPTVGTIGAGSLAAGTYLAKVVAVDALGGTTIASAEVSSGAVGASSSIPYTWTAVPGAVSYQLWFTSGATNTEANYFTTTTASYTLTTTAGATAGTPTGGPTTNNTGGINSTGALNITTARQYNGFILSNAGTQIVTFNGLTANNDGGTLSLFNAGVSNIRLSGYTGLANYINNGGTLCIGATSCTYTLDVTGDINTSTIYRVGGKVLVSATAPTIASGFNTSPTISANNGPAAFTINTGTTAATNAGVITLPTAATGWACHAHFQAAPTTTNFVVQQTATTTTSATFNTYGNTGTNNSWPASTTIVVSCFAY